VNQYKFQLAANVSKMVAEKEALAFERLMR